MICLCDCCNPDSDALYQPTSSTVLMTIQVCEVCTVSSLAKLYGKTHSQTLIHKYHLKQVTYSYTVQHHGYIHASTIKNIFHKKDNVIQEARGATVLVEYIVSQEAAKFSIDFIEQ